MIDPLTDVAMQTSGLTCDVLGTFYDQDGPGGAQMAFGSDVDNVYASSRLRVFKPWGESLQLFSSSWRALSTSRVRDGRSRSAGCGMRRRSDGSVWPPRRASLSMSRSMSTSPM